MSDRARLMLERAIAAEDRAEELEIELADVRGRLKAVVGADPTTAVSALGWMMRCQRAEKLLGDVVRYVDQRALPGTQLPPGWETRARAQLKAAEIAARDEEGFDRPSDDEYWSEYQTPDGTQRAIIDKA